MSSSRVIAEIVAGAWTITCSNPLADTTSCSRTMTRVVSAPWPSPAPGPACAAIPAGRAQSVRRAKTGRGRESRKAERGVFELMCQDAGVGMMAGIEWLRMLLISSAHNLPLPQPAVRSRPY